MRDYEACLYKDIAKVLEVSKTTADWKEVFKNFTSVKVEEHVEAILRVSEGVLSDSCGVHGTNANKKENSLNLQAFIGRGTYAKEQ